MSVLFLLLLFCFLTCKVSLSFFLSRPTRCLSSFLYRLSSVVYPPLICLSSLWPRRRISLYNFLSFLIFFSLLVQCSHPPSLPSSCCPPILVFLIFLIFLVFLPSPLLSKLPELVTHWAERLIFPSVILKPAFSLLHMFPLSSVQWRRDLDQCRHTEWTRTRQILCYCPRLSVSNQTAHLLPPLNTEQMLEVKKNQGTLHTFHFILI